MNEFEQLIVDAANRAWGLPLLIILMGGGLFFAIYSRFIPLLYFKHAVKVLIGKYDESEGKGEISHLQALSSHLAATIGMGNIAGVAVAISTGGPGAIFWMWISAFFGMITKFFTCTLAVMYRSEGLNGESRGGPMYVIVEGMGKKWRPMAIFFAICMALAATPLFQTNQLVKITREVVLSPMGLVSEAIWVTNLSIGLVVMVLTLLVIIGGIRRIAIVATRLVPFMIVLYMGSVLFILLTNFSSILPSLRSIFNDAFSGEAAMGGAIGALIVTGVRRAAFSNEAGIGSAPMMHGAAKTNEPVREGLVAMLGPFIDTVIVCTLTALCILITGVWEVKEIGGVELTMMAFEKSLGPIGPILLVPCVLTFSFTTIFSVSYYGKKSVAFLLGESNANYFNLWYIATIILGSITSLAAAISFIDLCYALMAVPTVFSAVYLAPNVMKEARKYFAKLS